MIRLECTRERSVVFNPHSRVNRAAKPARSIESAGYFVDSRISPDLAYGTRYGPGVSAAPLRPMSSFGAFGTGTTTGRSGDALGGHGEESALSLE